MNLQYTGCKVWAFYRAYVQTLIYSIQAIQAVKFWHYFVHKIKFEFLIQELLIFWHFFVHKIKLEFLIQELYVYIFCHFFVHNAQNKTWIPDTYVSWTVCDFLKMRGSTWGWRLISRSVLPKRLRGGSNAVVGASTILPNPILNKNPVGQYCARRDHSVRPPSQSFGQDAPTYL